MLRAGGLDSWTQPWLSQVKMLPFVPLALYSVAFIDIWSSMGVVILLFNAAIENVPETLHEAARIDGADATQGFYYVTVPLVGRCSELCSYCVLSACSAVLPASRQFTFC